MYLSIVKIDVLPGQEHIVMAVLEALKKPALTLAECLDCSFSIETDPNGMIWYQERWRDHESHNRRVRCSLYPGLLKVMQFSRTPPEVEFYEITWLGGLDVVESVRTPH